MPSLIAHWECCQCSRLMHVQPKVMLLSVDTNAVWTKGAKNVQHSACLADFRDGFMRLSKQRGKVEKGGEKKRQINLRV